MTKRVGHSTLSLKDAMQPMKLTCAKCGGEAWNVPISRSPLVLCSRCTFGEEGLTLVDMLARLYGKD